MVLAFGASLFCSLQRATPGVEDFVHQLSPRPLRICVFIALPVSLGSRAKDNAKTRDGPRLRGVSSLFWLRLATPGVENFVRQLSSGSRASLNLRVHGQGLPLPAARKLDPRLAPHSRAHLSSMSSQAFLNLRVHEKGQPATCSAQA